MNFERNFYKPSAVCPKCGTGDPKPKWLPNIPFTYGDNDRVVNLCVCGYEWEEKPKKPE